MAIPAVSALRLVPLDVESKRLDADERATLQQHLSSIEGGDEAALEALYEETIDRVYALVQRILNNTADSEEICEDVYLYVWRNAARYDNLQGSPMAWLLTLARSRAIDRHRHRARHQRLGDALSNEPNAEIVEEEPLALFYGTRLREQIAQLPEVQRQILTLAYFRGMTHAEISTTLSMSLGTVKTHIRRTLSALGDDLLA